MGVIMTQRRLKYKKFDSGRRFGVEIEVGSDIKKKEVQQAIKTVSNLQVYVSRYSLTTNNIYWHVKDDSSCGNRGRTGPKGVEIASFIGRGVADINHICEVAAKLKEIGCKVNDFCGLHIHAEVVDLSIKQVATIAAYWMKIENVLSMSLPPRRIRNHFCQFMFDPRSIHLFKEGVESFGQILSRQCRYSPEIFWTVICPKDISFYDNAERRFNLNLVNFVRARKYPASARGTIELRWPEGTLEPLDIRCWIKLFLNFIESCKNKPMPKNLLPCDLKTALEYLGLHHNKKSFFVLSSGIHETKTWFLNRILQMPPSDQLNESVQEEIRLDATSILNDMWSPIKKYS